jgi:C1A family cysteine protease
VTRVPYEEKRLSMKLRILTATAILLSVFLVTSARVDGLLDPQPLSSASQAVDSALPTADQRPVPQEAPTRPPPLRPRSPRTGFIPPRMDLSHLKGDRMPDGVTAQALPSRWDWREAGKVTSVKNQGDCGSCYAFASIASIESKLLIDGAGSFDFSENQAKECIWEELNNYEEDGEPWGSCDGGTSLAVGNLLSQKGTVLESCDPYVAADVACVTSCPYQKTVLDWRRITGEVVPDTDVLKAYVMTYGPVATSMYVGFDGFSNYDGSYTLYYSGPEEPDHGVMIVGWDDNLVHVGGTGGWIVKNSWGTNWGGTSGYGQERGYFTIAYGSASIGYYAGFLREWQGYDSTGELLYYDDAGWTGSWGYNAVTGWGLARFIPSKNTWLKRAEFWTTDATTDVDVYIYDSFDAMRVEDLLFSRLNLSFTEAGYHSVPVDPPLSLTVGDDVIAVVKFTNSSYPYPIPVDRRGPWERDRTYISRSGADGTWFDMGAGRNSDVGIRLRTSDTFATPTATPTATATRSPTTTSTRTPTITLTPTTPQTPTEIPPGAVTLTGLVYDAAIGPAQPIPGVVVSVVMCTPRAFQAMTGPDGRYSLFLPADYLNACAHVTLEAWAIGYYSTSEVVSVNDLRAQPVRDIGLHPTGWPTPTRLPSPTPRSVFLPIILRSYPPLAPTPTPTATPRPAQLIVNPSFETDEAWVIPDTDYDAGYSSSRAHSGWRSMRLGLEPGDNLFSYSSVQQMVEIPNGVTQAELSFYYFPLMVLGDDDRIYFCVLPDGEGQVDCSYWTDDSQVWHLRSFDLLPYAGQTIRVHFGVKNDGLAHITTVYLDDVELWVRW